MSAIVAEVMNGLLARHVFLVGVQETERYYKKKKGHSNDPTSRASVNSLPRDRHFLIHALLVI
jgi:hypothetical protein